MNDEFDLIDEMGEPPAEETDTLAQFQKRFRKLYAFLHFSMVVAIFLLGSIWIKNWIYTALIYIGGRLLLPKAMELFSMMGDYETDRMVVGTGEHVREVFGSFKEHYGIFSVLRDLVLYGIVILLGTGFVLSLLPSTVGGTLLIAAAVVAFFYILIFPLIEDVVQFFSAADKKEQLDEIKILISGALVILGLISVVVVPTYIAIRATAKLDANEALAGYYQELGDPDPYEDIDLHDIEVDFSDLRTDCAFGYTGELDLGNGYVYGGAEVEMKYHTGKGKWLVTEHSYVGVPTINKEVTYTGEGQFAQTGDYEGPVVLQLTFYPGTLEDGRGVVSIMEKASGKEFFRSEFTIEQYSDLEDAYPLTLDTPFPMKYFGVRDFYFCFEEDVEHGKIDAASGVLDLVLTE